MIFIQSLESRRFLSVTAATLAADKAAVVADAAAVKSALNVLITNNTTQTATIASYFKTTLPKSDQGLLNTLKTLEVESKGLFLKEVAALDNSGVSLANKSTAIGVSLLRSANIKSLASEEKDIIALQSVTTAPLAALSAHLAATAVDDARAAIVAAFPSDTALIAAVNTESTAAAAEKAAIGAAAQKFATDITTLGTDLASVHTAVGTFPNMLGSLFGGVVETRGALKGRYSDVTIVISTENTTTGAVTGTATDPINNGVQSLTGTVTLNGKFIGKTIGANPATLRGVFADGTLNGTFTAAKASGTFTATLAVI